VFETRACEHRGTLTTAQILSKVYGACNELLHIASRLGIIDPLLIPPPLPLVGVVIRPHVAPGKPPLRIPDTEFLPATFDIVTDEDTTSPTAVHSSKDLVEAVFFYPAFLSLRFCVIDIEGV
jgi:hypothetical protein